VIDPGLETLQRLVAISRPEPRWSLREARGLTWWPARHAQYLWVEPPLDVDGERVCRIHLRTDLLRRFRWCPENLRHLNRWAQQGRCFGLVRVPGRPKRLQWAACLYVDGRSIEDDARLLRELMFEQARCAEDVSERWSQVLERVAPARSAHPLSGRRPPGESRLEVDAMSRSDTPLPSSTWVERFAEDIPQEIARISRADDAGLVCRLESTPGGVVEVLHDAERQSVLFRLHIPSARISSGPSAPNGARSTLLTCNENEMTILSGASFLGSWLESPEAAEYLSVIPEAWLSEARIEALAEDLFRRANGFTQIAPLSRGT